MFFENFTKLLEFKLELGKMIKIVPRAQLAQAKARSGNENSNSYFDAPTVPETSPLIF